MELLQLQYFQVIARTQNISAAANELHISQPSLSQLLKRLELEMGTPLFNRVGKHIELNTYGIIFLKYVNEIFASLDNAEMEIQAIRNLSAKTVNLSVMSASMLLPDIYCELKNTDPTLLLHILQNGQEHLPRRDELIISSDWKLPSDTSSNHVLLEEEIQLALPKEHPLLGKSSICLEDLSGESFISLSPDSSLSRILSHYFSTVFFEPDITTYIDNPDIMRKLLTAHAGLAFIPTLTWHGFSSGDVILRRVENLPMKRFLILSWNANAFLTPSIRLCRDVIINFFTRYSLPDQ